jgi:signal transduction histidine kinase
MIIMRRNSMATLGAIIAILAITAAVIMFSKDEGRIGLFVPIAASTIISLFGLMKAETVQNAVAEVKSDVAELTNGKMHEAVSDAVTHAIAPIVETLEHATEEMSTVPKRGEEQ